ncbi:hypothetical protein ACG92U_09040 [Leuconostoc citreum]
MKLSGLSKAVIFIKASLYFLSLIVNFVTNLKINGDTKSWETSNKNINQSSDWRQKLVRLDNIKISGIGLVAYIIMAVLLVVAIRTHTLPNNMIGAILALVVMGHVFTISGPNYRFSVHI